MPRQLTVQTLRAFTEADLPASDDVDYDADYRILDLPSGASLREIEDRARLLHAAFHPDGVPAALQARAVRRSRMVSRAAGELSQYWKTHGAAPPTDDADRQDAPPPPAGLFLAPAEGLVAALAEALEAGMEATADDAAAAGIREEPDLAQTSVIPDGLDGVLGGVRGLRPRPGMRLVRDDEGADQSDAAVHPIVVHQALGPPSQGDRMVRWQPPLGRSPAVPQTGPIDGGAGSAIDGRRSTPRQSRTRSIAGSVLFTLAIAGLVAAAGVRLQQYRADHLALRAAVAPEAAPEAAITAGSPDGAPARWAGLASSQQPTGAAAPPFAAHQR